MKARTKQIIVLILVSVGLLSVAHRLWFQFRPLPTHILVQRPMTQAEWEARLKAKGAVPTNFFMVDSFPYPDPVRDIVLTPTDFRTIRALAAWGSFMPYRVTFVGIWSSTNVSVRVNERGTSELRFVRDPSGWRMTPVGGQIDWMSEKDKPIISFH